MISRDEREQHPLNIVLDIQCRLQTLTRAITNSVALLLRAEWPRPLRRMPILVLVVHGVLPNLTLLQPSEGLDQRVSILLLVCEPALHERLTHERDIPKLTPVRSTHHHPLGTNPHEVQPSELVHLICVRLGPFDVRATDEVEHLADGAECLVTSVLILFTDE